MLPPGDWNYVLGGYYLRGCWMGTVWGLVVNWELMMKVASGIGSVIILEFGGVPGRD